MILDDTSKMVEEFDKILKELQGKEKKEKITVKFCIHEPQMYCDRMTDLYRIECPHCGLKTIISPNYIEVRQDWEKIKNTKKLLYERDNNIGQ